MRRELTGRARTHLAEICALLDGTVTIHETLGAPVLRTTEGKRLVASIRQKMDRTKPYRSVKTDILILKMELGPRKRYTELKKTGKFNLPKCIPWMKAIIEKEKKDAVIRLARARAYDYSKDKISEMRDARLLDIEGILIGKIYGRPGSDEQPPMVYLEIYVPADDLERFMRAIKNEMES